MIDPKMVMWIRSSIAKHFGDIADAVPFWCEGQNLDPLLALPKWCELRITGPSFKELHAMTEIQVSVNLMCCLKMTANQYDIDRLVGQFVAGVIPIEIFKSVADGNTYLGCLTLRNDVPRPIDTIPWGMVQQANGQARQLQTSIDAYYQMTL